MSFDSRVEFEEGISAKRFIFGYRQWRKRRSQCPRQVGVTGGFCLAPADVLDMWTVTRYERVHQEALLLKT